MSLLPASHCQSADITVISRGEWLGMGGKGKNLSAFSTSHWNSELVWLRLCFHKTQTYFYSLKSACHFPFGTSTWLWQQPGWLQPAAPEGQEVPAVLQSLLGLVTHKHKLQNATCLYTLWHVSKQRLPHYLKLTRLHWCWRGEKCSRCGNSKLPDLGIWAGEAEPCYEE